MREGRAYGKSRLLGRTLKNTGILPGRTQASGTRAWFGTQLALCRINGDRTAYCARLLLRIFCGDVPDLPGDRY